MQPSCAATCEATVTDPSVINPQYCHTQTHTHTHIRTHTLYSAQHTHTSTPEHTHTHTHTHTHIHTHPHCSSHSPLSSETAQVSVASVCNYALSLPRHGRTMMAV